MTSNVLLLGLLAGGMAIGASRRRQQINREPGASFAGASGGKPRRGFRPCGVSGVEAASFVNGQAIAVSGGMDWIP